MLICFADGLDNQLVVINTEVALIVFINFVEAFDPQVFEINKLGLIKPL